MWSNIFQITGKKTRQIGLENGARVGLVIRQQAV